MGLEEVELWKSLGKLEGAGRVGGVVRTGGRTSRLGGRALDLGERLKWRGGRGHWNWGRGGERPEGCGTSPWAWQAQDGGRAWGGDEGSEHGCRGNQQTAAESGGVIGPLPAKFLLLWSTKPSSPSYSLVSQFHDKASQLSTVDELVSPDFRFPFYEIREQVQATSMISLSSKNF